MIVSSTAYQILGAIHKSADAPWGREGSTKSVIKVSSEGGRGIIKVSADFI